MLEKTNTIDEIIREIKEVLCESDGIFIEEIANKILTEKVIYIGDGFFKKVVKK